MKTDITKVAFCSCGCGGWVILAAMPRAETDRDAIKDFRKAVLEGCEVKYLTRPEIPFDKAGCQKPKVVQTSLF